MGHGGGDKNGWGDVESPAILALSRLHDAIHRQIPDPVRGTGVGPKRPTAFRCRMTTSDGEGDVSKRPKRSDNGLSPNFKSFGCVHAVFELDAEMAVGTSDCLSPYSSSSSGPAGICLRLLCPPDAEHESQRCDIHDTANHQTADRKGGIGCPALS